MFHITQDNLDEALGEIEISSESRQDIRRSVSQFGYEAIVHEAPITVPGWRGSGYVLTHPETGAGKYMIDGGKNGGFVGSAIDFFVELFFELIEKGGLLGKVASWGKAVIDRVVIFIDLIKECSTGTAIIGIIVVTLLATGLALTGIGLLLAKVLILKVLYALFISWVVSETADSFLSTCRQS